MRQIRRENGAFSVWCESKNHTIALIGIFALARNEKSAGRVNGHTVDVQFCGNRCLNTQRRNPLNSVAGTYEKISIRIKRHRFRVCDC